MRQPVCKIGLKQKTPKQEPNVKKVRTACMWVCVYVCVLFCFSDTLETYRLVVRQPVGGGQLADL